MRKLVVLAAVAIGFFAASPAFAIFLTDTDLEYLATQDIKRGSSVLNGLSPKERSRLHTLINDPATEGDLVARAKIVRDALNEFEANQDWEKRNPGQLWDAPRRDKEKPPRD